MKVVGGQSQIEAEKFDKFEKTEKTEKMSNLNCPQNTINVNSPQNNVFNINNSSSSTLLPLDVELQPNSIYENLDNKETYKAILKEISFFDENHTKYSSDHSEEDLSSIIAYTLTSDKYREFISPHNRFKLIEIKCERKPKVPFDCTQHFKEKSFCDGQGNNTNNAKQAEDPGENKYGYNFFNTQDEEVHETSLLFDQSKNTYQYQNLDNHKIYQQLETELLSDEKVHFTYITSNSNIMNQLSTWNMPIEFFRKKNEKEINIGATSNLITNANKLTKDLSSTDLPHLAAEKNTEKTANALNTINTLNVLNPAQSQLQNPNIISSSNPNTNPMPTSEKIYQDQSDEKIILQGDNIKITLEEIESIRGQLKSLKEKNSGGNLNTENKPKRKVSDFLEESILVSLEYEVIAYYPRQFEALRITYCATYDEFILSVSRNNFYRKFFENFENF